jgi:hypothetical protein
MFAKVHLKQEEGWCLDKNAITIHNSFFSAHQEQEVIISPNKIMDDTSRAQYSKAVNLMGGIRNKSQ